MYDDSQSLDTFQLIAIYQFVEVHQALLNILIGKAGVLNDLPLIGPPMAQALRSVEAVVDVRLSCSGYLGFTY
jgi:hypothetical protein